MHRVFFAVLGMALLWGCADDAGHGARQDSDVARDAAMEGVGEGLVADAGPLPLASTRFGALARWARPIDDYIKAGEARFGAGKVLRHIHDLVVYQHRLYLGYGDANVNMGRVVPISFRYFASPRSTAVIREFNSDDEHLERYRRVGDDLFMAGVDATEDAWLGNVYSKRGAAGWFKSRTLKGGVHVHDVVGFGGAIYAVGSGATRAEWSAGKIFGYLWKSTDRGRTFVVQDRKPNDQGGDCRFVRLLPTAKTLYMFGYKSNRAGVPVDVINSRYDGHKREDLPESHPLRHVWVNDTYVLGKGLYVLRGSKIKVVKKMLYSTWRVTDSGQLQEVRALAGRTTIDVYPIPGRGEALVMSHAENDALKVAKITNWKVEVAVTSDFRTFTRLLTFSVKDRPKSVAYWQGGIYVGDSAGQVWRATRVGR